MKFKFTRLLSLMMVMFTMFSVSAFASNKDYYPRQRTICDCFDFRFWKITDNSLDTITNNIITNTFDFTTVYIRNGSCFGYTSVSIL